MSAQYQPTRTATITPAAAIAAHRFVTWAWAQAGAGADCMGVAAENIEPKYPGLVILGETAIVEAGAALDGSVRQLKSDAQGRAIPCATGNAVQAVLKPGQTATAAGGLVEVYLTNHISPL